MEASGPCIGIDLGTTKCCVGIWRDNHVEIIPNEQGNRTTPSYVAFTESERFIGETAKIQAPRNPSNTVLIPQSVAIDPIVVDVDIARV